MDALLLDIDVPRARFDVRADLRVARETVALVGASGAGKTTVLRAVAGLVRPRAGRIALGDELWFDARRGLHLEPEERAVGMVFQDYALFPHLDVRANVAFGADGRDPAPLLERFGIAHLARDRPGTLSGGERQRVALARALARRPRVVLLDEPMAALDPHTREGVRAELRATLAELGLPVLLVTHDFADAVALADRIAVMREGAVLQTGTAAELAGAPIDPFVTAFTRQAEAPLR